MRVIVVLIIVFSFATSIISISGYQGPPVITGELKRIQRVRIGDTVKLECPIDSGASGLTVYFEWTKDGETITSAWERFRVTPKKLRIKGLISEDGGLFQCKGTNGFGSKELSTRLLVEDEDGNVVGGLEEEENETASNKNLSSDEILGVRPSFTEITAPPFGATFKQEIGSSLTLHCKAEGYPLPNISWFKNTPHRDEFEIPISNGEELELLKIDENSKGVYTCVASNVMGQINASFIVEIKESTNYSPTIVSFDVTNLTNQQDTFMHFKCLIKSETVPTFQLLQRAEDKEILSLDASFNVNGERYKVISTGNKVETLPNCTYLGEIIVRINGSDNIFGCLATNLIGYSFQRRDIRDSEKSTVHLAVIVAILATLIFIIVFTLSTCYWCHSMRKSRNMGTISTSATYATPCDVTSTNEYQSPQHGYFQGKQQCSSNTSTYPTSFLPSCNKTNVTNTQNLCQDCSSPAYASVVVRNFIDPHTSQNSIIPMRTTFISNDIKNTRSGYHAQGILTQPLLTYTGSSSDSRDSRKSHESIRPQGSRV